MMKYLLKKINKLYKQLNLLIHILIFKYELLKKNYKYNDTMVKAKFY